MRLLISFLVMTCLFVGQSWAADKIFNGPKFHNARIDSCLSDVGACGQPAADVFCKGQGFLRAKKYSVANTTAKTIYAGNYAECKRRQCVPFDRIACTDSLSVEATSETDIGTVKP